MSLSVVVEPSDTLFEQKQSLLSSLGLRTKFELEALAASHTEISEFVSTARVSMLSPKELYFHTTTNSNNNKGGCDQGRIEHVGGDALAVCKELEVKGLGGRFGFVGPRNERLAVETCHRLLDQANKESPHHSEVIKRVVTNIHEFARCLCLPANQVLVQQNSIGVSKLSKQFSELSRAHGVSSHVTLEDGLPSGRGFVAATDISPGDAVITIPLSLIFNIHSAETSPEVGPVIKALRNSDPDFHDDTGLILLILAEFAKGDRSRWAFYWSTLPSEFHNTLSWNNSEVELLRGTGVLEETQMNTMDLRFHFDNLFPTLSEQHPEIFPANVCTWEKFVWVRSILDTRCVTLAWPNSLALPTTATTEEPPSQTHAVTCLIPFGDMFNHHPHAQISHPKVDLDAHAIVFPAFGPCVKGAEVFLNYGSLQNTQLLTYYGYVMQNNPFDAIELDLSPPEDDPVLMQKILFLAHLQIPQTHFLPICPDSTENQTNFALPPQALTALRVCVCDDADMENLGKSVHGPINKKSENEALLVLQQTLQSMLDGFEKTQGDDESESDTNSDAAKADSPNDTTEPPNPFRLKMGTALRSMHQTTLQMALNCAQQAAAKLESE